MCYNCGCQMPDKNMGNDDNITTKTFEKAARATGQSIEKTKENVYELLKKELKK